MEICEVEQARSIPAVAAECDANRVAVTVVIPCFNEAEGIHHTIASLVRAKELCAPQYDLRVLFIDDASTDDTHSQIQAAIGGLPDFELVKHAVNRGITAAIMTGLAHSTTELVASLDADCTYDPAQLPHLLPLLTNDVAMVTASPYHPRGGVENVPAWRLWISGGCSQLYRWVMRTRLYTYTSCFRVYRRSSLLGWVPQNTGFVGLVEMIRFLEERGERTVECPAVLKVRQFGQSKMRILRVIQQHLRFISQTCIRRITSRKTPSLRTAVHSNSNTNLPTC